jgi:CRISPR-associated protein Cmr2
MNQYLFLFTIGPVQSFIAQARKTKDLYIGSKLLSDLIDKVMKEITKINNSYEFIFPSESIKFKPNRFLIRIKINDIQNLGEKIEKFIKKEFENYSEYIFKAQFKDKNKPRNFDNQIENFLDIRWVSLPFNNKNEYAEKHEELERMLGGLKNTRKFKQINNGFGEIGRKCSLCGERNILFFSRVNKDKKPVFIQDDAFEINDHFTMMNRGEGLCAIGFIKRFYRDRREYPSTAKITLLDWLINIQKDKCDNYKRYFSNFDEQLFYKENLTKKYLEKYGYFKNNIDIEEAKKELGDLYKRYGKPPKYYALVMLDGDNMGEWLSGKYLMDKNKLYEFHRTISKSLGDYAESVENIVLENKGKLVYTGGDDVMVFVNLEHMFDIVGNLRNNFPKFENLGIELNSNIVSTVSAGIAIAHYKTPLQEVLKWARNMEKKEAKEKGGRDAFAIAVLKHSGEIHKTVWKWDLNSDGENSEHINSLDILKKLHRMLKNEELSNTFIKALNIEFLKMMDKKGKWQEKKLIETELMRLFLRSLNKISNETEVEFKKRKNDIKNIFIPKLNLMFSNRKTLNNFLQFLNIADFLGRKVTR